MNKKTLDERKQSGATSGVPSYLFDEQKFQEQTTKDYELVNPAQLKYEAQMEKIKE